jgi:hypothetical protein
LSYTGVGVFSLETSSLSNKNNSVTVFDLLGNVLQPKIRIDNNVITIDLEAYSAGTYIIQYENETDFARYKVVK